MYEIKLDGYRIQATKSEGKVQLRSRNDNDFTVSYALIASALHRLPNETVIDSEVVAPDEDAPVLRSPRSTTMGRIPDATFFISADHNGYVKISSSGYCPQTTF